MHVSWIATITVLLPSLAYAQAAPVKAQEAPIVVQGQKLARPDERIVCKVTDTGTLIPKRICKPKFEWQRATNAAPEQVRTMQDWQQVRCNFGGHC